MHEQVAIVMVVSEGTGLGVDLTINHSWMHGCIAPYRDGAHQLHQHIHTMFKTEVHFTILYYKKQLLI